MLTWNVQGRRAGRRCASAASSAPSNRTSSRCRRCSAARPPPWRRACRCRPGGGRSSTGPSSTPPEGLAVLTPHRLVRATTFHLRRAPFWSWKRRIGIDATVEADGHELRVIDVHLSSHDLATALPRSSGNRRPGRRTRPGADHRRRPQRRPRPQCSGRARPRRLARRLGRGQRGRRRGDQLDARGASRARPRRSGWTTSSRLPGPSSGRAPSPSTTSASIPWPLCPTTSLSSPPFACRERSGRGEIVPLGCAACRRRTPAWTRCSTTTVCWC